MNLQLADISSTKMSTVTQPSSRRSLSTRYRCSEQGNKAHEALSMEINEFLENAAAIRKSITINDKHQPPKPVLGNPIAADSARLGSDAAQTSGSTTDSGRSKRKKWGSKKKPKITVAPDDMTTGTSRASNALTDEVQAFTLKSPGTRLNGSSPTCFKCNKVGHTARECSAPGPTCYNCNEVGHISRNCTAPKREAPTCYRCGEKGHIARNCSVLDSNKTSATSKQKSVRPPPTCYNCGEQGHIARHCQQTQPDLSAGMSFAQGTNAPRPDAGRGRNRNRRRAHADRYDDYLRDEYQRMIDVASNSEGLRTWDREVRSDEYTRTGLKI